MINEQKQKVLQLLELCIDNSKANVAECYFNMQPNTSSINVNIFVGKWHGAFDESHSAYLDIDGGESRLDSIIEAVRTLPERSIELAAKREAERRAKIKREYAELFGKSPATTE